MNKLEVADLLEFCAGYDRRELTDDAVDGWHQSLKLVDLDDAKEAVAHHYQRNSTRVMPSHVWEYVRPTASRHPSSAPVPVRLAVPQALASQGAQRVIEAVARAQAADQARRERVLRHPDLARKLTQPPLGYADPAQWTGYVPPAECHDEAPEGVHSTEGHPNAKGRRTGATRPNTSLRRKALVAICAEALKREREVS